MYFRRKLLGHLLYPRLLLLHVSAVRLVAPNLPSIMDSSIAVFVLIVTGCHDLIHWNLSTVRTLPIFSQSSLVNIFHFFSFLCRAFLKSITGTRIPYTMKKGTDERNQWRWQRIGDAPKQRRHCLWYQSTCQSPTPEPFLPPGIRLKLSLATNRPSLEL